MSTIFPQDGCVTRAYSYIWEHKKCIPQQADPCFTVSEMTPKDTLCQSRTLLNIFNKLLPLQRRISWCPGIIIICSICSGGLLILPDFSLFFLFSTIHLTQMKVVFQPKQKTVTLMPLPFNSEKILVKDIFLCFLKNCYVWIAIGIGIRW